MSGTIFNSLYVLTKLILTKPLGGRYCFLPHFTDYRIDIELQMFSRVDLNNINKFKDSFLIDKKMFSFYNLLFLLVMNDTVFPIFLDPQYTSELSLSFFFWRQTKYIYTAFLQPSFTTPILRCQTSSGRTGNLRVLGASGEG